MALGDYNYPSIVVDYKYPNTNTGKAFWELLSPNTIERHHASGLFSTQSIYLNIFNSGSYYFKKSNMSEEVVEEKPPIPPYRNGEHCVKAFQTMNSLRLQNILCDVIIRTGGIEFPAHKVVLASCSAYFFAMFTGELSESKQTHVTMKDVDPIALELLLEFAYTAEIHVTEENVQVWEVACT